MDMPLDQRQKIMEMLGVEGYIAGLFREAGQNFDGEDVFVAEVEYDLWDDEEE